MLILGLKGLTDSGEKDKMLLSMAQFKSTFRGEDPDFSIFKDCTVISWKFHKREMFYLVESHPVPNLIVNCCNIF